MKKIIFVLINLFLASYISSYVVKEGDTLWDLSDQFLSSPFDWEDIWTANPDIENPDLIYPGEELVIPGQSARLEEDYSLHEEGWVSPDKIKEKLPEAISAKNRYLSREERRADLLHKLGMEEPVANEKGLEDRNNSAKKNFAKIIKPALQIKAPRLEIPVAENKMYPNELSVTDHSEHQGQLLKPFENFLAKGKDLKEFKEGDYLELYHVDDKPQHIYRKSSLKPRRTVQSVGIAQIKSIHQSTLRAQVLQVFATIKAKDVKMRKLPKTPPVKVKRYTKYEGTVKSELAEIIDTYKDANLTLPMQWVTLNKGKNSGFNPGDGIAIWEDSKEGLAPRLLGNGVIIHSGNLYSTALLKNIRLPNRSVESRDLVSITHKAL